jgi:hypothetical protein
MMRQRTNENQACVQGKSEYGAAETTFGFPETLSLFHALAGMCIGWSWGALHGVLVGIGVSLAGCAVGFVLGFLMTHLPQDVHVVTARIGRRHRLVRALCGIAGHLVWLGLGAAFWWLLFAMLRG